MGKAKSILFLYGSLKRDQMNNGQMAGQEYRCDAESRPEYRILDLGKYPGLIRDEARGFAVRGELWEVSAEYLAQLDAFEGGEGLYARFPIAIEGHEGIQAYFWMGEVPAGIRDGREWPFPPR